MTAQEYRANFHIHDRDLGHNDVIPGSVGLDFYTITEVYEAIQKDWDFSEGDPEGRHVFSDGNGTHARVEMFKSLGQRYHPESIEVASSSQEGLQRVVRDLGLVCV